MPDQVAQWGSAEPEPASRLGLGLGPCPSLCIFVAMCQPCDDARGARVRWDRLQPPLCNPAEGKCLWIMNE